MGQRGGKTDAGTGTMWNWQVAKIALEWLFYTGEVTTATRRGFERVYDLLISFKATKPKPGVDVVEEEEGGEVEDPVEDASNTDDEDDEDTEDKDLGELIAQAGYTGLDVAVSAYEDALAAKDGKRLEEVVGDILDVIENNTADKAVMAAMDLMEKDLVGMEAKEEPGET